MRKFSVSKVFLSLALVFQIFSIYGLDPKKETFLFKNDIWKVEQGLPQYSVFAITQTSDGYLWFGTQEGLARFNGIRFDVFDRDRYESIKSNYITCLVEDREKTLWIGTEGGGIVSFKNNTFSLYTTDNGLLSNNIKVLFIGSDNSIWIGTESGLSRLKNNKIENIVFPKNRVSSSNISAIFEDKNGEIWIGIEGSGIVNLKKGDSGFSISSTFFPELDVSTILADHNGQLWVGTRNSGLVRLEDKKGIFYTKKNGLSSNYVTVLCEDRDSNLWIGTHGGGLNRLQDGKITVYRSRDGLSNDIIWSIYEDVEGNLWVGTHGGGVNQLKDTKVFSYTQKHGLLNDDIRGIFQDSRGNIWIGTGNNGICLFRDKKFYSYTTRDGLVSNKVFAICEDKKGYMWFGTYGGGVSRFRNGRFKNYTTREGLSSNFIRSMYCDSSGDVWIGNYGSGLDCFSGGRIKSYKKKDGLSHERISIILEDSKGYLWVGTIGGGLNRIKDGKIEVFDREKGVAHNNIFSLYEDNEGVLWIGTYEGLNCYKDDRFYSVKKKDGLFDNLLFSILEDNAENLWMSCNKGIFKVSKSELEAFWDGKTNIVHSTSYGIDDGMASNECNGVCQPAGWKSVDGRLWFPTIKGVAVVDPQRMRINRVLPSIVVEKIVINENDYSKGEKIVVPPGNGNVEINYAGLSFVDPKMVVFKYRLEGFEENWKDAGTRRAAYYTNIPPGNYVFKVIARNNDGFWNNTGSSIGFYLKPDFYQTLWFQIAVVLCVGLLGFGIYLMRVKQLKKNKRELENLVNERTRQLADANEELQRLATMDGLTGIANHRRFIEFFESEWRRAIRNARPISLIIADVDFFKLYNDTYGYQAGDECLKKIAVAINRTVNRSGDLVARYGGEEFIVVLSETDDVGTLEIAKKLKLEVEEMGIIHDVSSVSGYVTISLGCATVIPVKDFDSSSLIKAADEALYQSKEGGRNRITVHGHSAY